MQIDRRLISYVRQHKDLGYSDNVLKAHLLKHGYPIEIIHEIMLRASQKKEPDKMIDRLNIEAKGTFHYLKVMFMTIFGIAAFASLMLFFEIKEPIAIALVCFLIVIYGTVCATILNKSATSSTAFELGIYIVASVTSLLLSTVFVFMDSLAVAYKSTGELASSMRYMIHPMPDPFIAGILFAFLFSLPSLMYYFRWEEKRHFVFISYLIWMIAYVIVHKILMPMLF
ncbi:hypothetical protein COV93_08060 [Candidatus Woesearchaeota archaeon CG11_big_fil_rev_8_21_14_0_20_43_8]|nr:MAG: hypothetical protein COV93_08060 [Candidatus Woesearchaeota archaeon CG11_big_fil_rev_8_21_14_0_20_43_8]